MPNFKKISKSMSVISITAAMTFSVISPTFAITSPTAAAVRAQNREAICNDVQKTVQARMALKEDIVRQFSSRYTNLKAKLTNVQTTVSTKFPSVDLTSLQVDLTKLDELYTSALKATEEAQTALSNVDFKNCLSGTGEFKTQLQNARVKTKTAAEAHKAYWSVVTNSVKNDLQRIKSDIQSLKDA